MVVHGVGRVVTPVGAVLAICAVLTGCLSGQLVPPTDIPRELNMVSLPTYVVEPPDILTINAIRLVPKPPYRVEPLDIIALGVSGILKDDPQIEGQFTVDVDGSINLGATYGGITVAGMTLREIQAAIEALLRDKFKVLKPQVVATLVQSRGLQLIQGEHLLRPDGTVGLGIYGSAYLAGLPLPEAKLALEKHLSQFFLNPNISLDVVAYNSKVFYVITDTGGYGQTVTRLPITGNERVLDAIALVNGLPREASKHHIWVARPAPPGPNGECQDQILPVDWNKVTQCGSTATNYQLLPGDRLFVKADPLITLDTIVAKLTAPAERIFGVSLLGRLTILEFQQRPNSGGTGTGSGIGGGAGGGF